MIPATRFDISPPLSGECSEGLDAFKFIFKHFPPLYGDAFSVFFKLMFPPTSTVVLVNVLTIFECDNWVNAQEV